jgi:hypothetical protein
LWFILPGFISQKLYYALIGESFAVLCESFIIMFILGVNYRKAIISSFVCNMTSFLFGLIIRWP